MAGRILALFLLLLLAPARALGAGRILRGLPEKIDPRQDYLIYLHGRIIEEEGLRPTSPEFGVYEYEKILAGFAGRGFVVISEARPRGTDPGAYADKVVGQVRALLHAGVPPAHIAVVGFSKGGGIALLTASRLAEPKVNFVILAGCGGETPPEIAQRLQGRILSMFDASDDRAATCKTAFAQAKGPLAQEEEVLHLGTGHGAFYRPGDWLERAARWVKQADVAVVPRSAAE
jgi:pimeloyl-ACP methyl ester carboxylesterase